MARTDSHTWEFKARFRRHAFGWKSQPAIQRVKEASPRSRRSRARIAVLAAEGAVTLLERLSPALEHVDSSSGAIGTAVNNAIAELVPIIAERPGRREDPRPPGSSGCSRRSRRGPDPVHREPRRLLGRAVRLEGGRLRMGRPAPRHHAHGAQPRQEPARPLPRDDGVPERALRRRALRRPARRPRGRELSGPTSAGR